MESDHVSTGLPRRRPKPNPSDARRGPRPNQAPAKKARTESDEAAARGAYASLRRELATSQAALLHFWKEAPRRLGRDLRAVREAAAALGDSKVVAKVDAMQKYVGECSTMAGGIARQLADPRLQQGETAVRSGVCIRGGRREADRNTLTTPKHETHNS